MFYDLDFSYWQSWLVVFIVLFMITFSVAVILWSCFMFYVWLMQYFIERDIRNGKIRWLRLKEDDE